MDILALDLSLEQEFLLKNYEQQVKCLSPERAQEFLLEAFRLLMIKDNAIRSLVKSSILNIDAHAQDSTAIDRSDLPKYKIHRI
ncbi:NblA/ycf18 family protein [Chamaesiphon minutus]|uniref:Phycobilisome degradation protein nblA n=1 Tax=Chamaesiphon minutus (strain ATCC 27169 / PCC 6605) TaxID=1173020 RepID=K9UHV5_CHAP6|nr:NblA/ycf18 family protein [Chamaesiphon minutus]AFY93764.1 Phycobilisome degradation protein nblA [Chamaesiphon minutus PCC 6605]